MICSNPFRFELNLSIFFFRSKVVSGLVLSMQHSHFPTSIYDIAITFDSKSRVYLSVFKLGQCFSAY